MQLRGTGSIPLGVCMYSMPGKDTRNCAAGLGRFRRSEHYCSPSTPERRIAWQCRLSLHTWHIIIKKSRRQLRRGNRHTREEELFCPQLILIRLSRFRLGLRACAVAFAWFESYSIECRTVNPEGFGLMTGTTQRADRSTEL